MLIYDTKTLRQLTGNYFANNDFDKVSGDIDLATEELAKIVGWAVIVPTAETKSCCRRCSGLSLYSPRFDYTRRTTSRTKTTVAR